MAESMPVTEEVGEEEESEYSYVYETDSEYSYYTESEGEEQEEQGQVTAPAQEPGDESSGRKSDPENDAAEVSNSPEVGDEEDENEALRRHKQQLERFKPKIPDYVKSPEPCAFSDDPGTWIAWMEDQVNKEKNRRMELIMKGQEEEENEESVRPVMEVEQQESPMDCHTTETSEDSMEDDNNGGTDQNRQTEESALDQPSAMIIDSPDNNNNGEKVEDGDSEWEWEYEDEEGEEAEVCMSLHLNQQEPPAQEVEVESEVRDKCDLESVVEKSVENVGENDGPGETPPAEQSNAEEQGNARLTLDKQMSLPAENRRSELVPKDMQEKINFIRKKKAEAASGQLAVPGENPTNKSAASSLLDEGTKRKLAFIKQHKKDASSSELDNTDDSIKPNDPLDPETRRKLEFVRKNKKNSAPTKSDDNEAVSGLSSPAPPALLRQQSNPEGGRTSGRPTSLAEQYGDDSNLNDMLARIKTLREERKQILQDMNAIKTAFNGPGDGAEVDRGDTATDDGIETGESTPCTEISAPFKEAQGVQGARRRSFDSGIGTKSLSSVQGGSPTEELDAISETSAMATSASHPGKKKISKEEKEHSDGVFYCFMCGENLGKMTKGTVMHMGLEDGEPVCPDALYLTDESKEKIMAIASTRTFTLDSSVR